MTGTGSGHGDGATGAVRVRLLGGFRLEVDGVDRSRSMPARARSLLAFLAIHPDTAHDRQRIAFLFWPDSSEAQARTNLRNLLHHLRRAGPEVAATVEVTQGTVAWAGGDAVEIDVAAVETALAEAAAAEAGSAAETAALRAAVDHYRGDLLEGSYEEWLEEDRSRLRERVVAALRRLVELHLARAEPTAAVATARELVRRDPLHEDHHRLLISAHAAAGDRAGAVRAYHECVEVLEQELGVEPSAATRRAYADALADEATTAGGEGDGPRGAEPARVVATPAAPPALVGRGPEWEAAGACWAAASAGSPRLLTVTGEPGVGKTRLVEDLAVSCARQGALVARARSYPTEGELGFGAVIEWLRTPDLVPALTAVAPGDRSELARLLPELAGDAGPPPRPPDDSDRVRLFEAIASALEVAGRPVLLVADDAHWCDAASLQVVHFLARSSRILPVLVATTARREELDDRHPLTAITEGLVVIDRATVLELDRLGPDETAALATSLGCTGIDDEAAVRLHRETEGNPLFVVEAVRAGWDATSERVDLSPRLQSVIGARLRQLGEPGRLVLDVAAVVGRSFTADLVARAAGLDDLTLVRGLDELWRRGVIEGHDVDAYDFTHGKVREAAYEALSPAVRTHLHHRVADALATTVADPEAASGQIAAHYDRAGRWQEAIDWYRRAAATAIRRGGHTEAVRVLERAADLTARLPAAEAGPVELEILTLLPPALGGVVGFADDRLTEVQQRATGLAAHLGVELAPPMLRSLVMSSLCRDEFDEADAAAERLRRAGVTAADEGLELEGVYLLGVIAFWSGRFEEAIARFDEMVERYDGERHPDHLVRFGQDSRIVCLSRKANALWFLGRTDEAVATRDRALAMVEELDEFLTSTVVHLFAALLALDTDDPDLLRRVAAGYGAGRRLGGVFRLNGDALHGLIDVLEGRADRGLARIEASVEASGGQNLAPSSLATLYRLLTAAAAIAGAHATTIDATARAVAHGGTRIWHPEHLRLRAVALAALGRPRAEVDAALGQADDVATRLHAAGHLARIAATRETLSKRRARDPARP